MLSLFSDTSRHAHFGKDSFEVSLNDGNRQSIFFSSLSAVAFKNAKQFEQAKDACLREAVAHENNRAYLFSL